MTWIPTFAALLAPKTQESYHYLYGSHVVYDLRHSFASLLLRERRGDVIYVARQLGHGAQLTLSTYGHVIEELDGEPHADAETAIEAARSSQVTHERRTEVS